MALGELKYVVEHHENAFYYWCKLKKETNIENFFLVAIDWHKDMLPWGAQFDVRKEINQLDLGALDKVEELAMAPVARIKSLIDSSLLQWRPV